MILNNGVITYYEIDQRRGLRKIITVTKPSDLHRDQDKERS